MAGIAGDRFGLARFVRAQEGCLDTVRAELRNGRKVTHWMWFVFPQAEGLGYSPMSQRYAIASLDEARAYLRHPVLGTRLLECAEILLGLSATSAHAIFGSPDDSKLRSSLTLFELADPSIGVFGQLLERYFDGQRDDATIAIVDGWPGSAEL